MAWQDEAVPILRVLIDDAVSPYTYSDTRLEDVLVSVAKLLISDTSFNTTYSVVVKTSTITPDPEEDKNFISLLCLKTAYVIATAEYKQYSISGGMSIVDGPSTVDFSSIASSLKDRVKRLSDDYTKARIQFSLGSAIGYGAVITPTTNDGVNPYRIRYFREQT